VSSVPPDDQRVYYDHEPAYRKIKATGGRGWDDLYPGTDPHSYDALDAFLAGETPPPGTPALEIGCGGGQAALRIARRGFATTGVDYSETAIELARANAREAGLAARFEVGDVLALAAFAGDSFDLVVDNHCLHCIVAADDRARTLASIHRVLAPGGRLWTGTMAAEGNFDPARFDVDPVTGIARTGRRIWIRRAVFEHELRVAGFAIESLALIDSIPPEDGTDIVAIARKR